MNKFLIILSTILLAILILQVGCRIPNKNKYTSTPMIKQKHVNARFKTQWGSRKMFQLKQTLREESEKGIENSTLVEDLISTEEMMRRKIFQLILAYGPSAPIETVQSVTNEPVLKQILSGPFRG